MYNSHSSLVIPRLLPSTHAYLGHRIPIFKDSLEILQIEKTLICLRRACNLIASIIRGEGHFVLVNANANKVYSKIVQGTAKRTNQSYIDHEWIGGVLTNWEHMIDLQKHGDDALTSSPFLDYLRKMKNCLGGIMTHRIPNCLVVMNANLSSMAILEADQLRIPIVSPVDCHISNGLHELITYPIPVNDYDSIQFVYLFCNLVTKTVIHEAGSGRSNLERSDRIDWTGSSMHT
uniref:Ribosomal protein S2 n=1 Tax=Isoetes engelmannii TaxID=37427 RepID=G0Y649_ISOEN|nr:ribosomal protein S2 [Isoetes engelmannii]